MNNKLRTLPAAVAAGIALLIDGTLAFSADNLELAANQPTLVSAMPGDSGGVYIVQLSDKPFSGQCDSDGVVLWGELTAEDGREERAVGRVTCADGE